MIPYEELCSALERWSSRNRNEAELAALERGEPQDGPSSSPARDLSEGATDPDIEMPPVQAQPESGAAFRAAGEDNTQEIDVDDGEMVMDDK